MSGALPVGLLLALLVAVGLVVLTYANTLSAEELVAERAWEEQRAWEESLRNGGHMERSAHAWVLHRRKGRIWLRPYVPGEDLRHVSVSATDTPTLGGHIARNPDDPNDQWYVAAAYAAKHYEPVVEPVVEPVE